MWVEPELLSSGGQVARNAGDRVLNGAAALASTPVGTSIFGDFAAARAFQMRLGELQIGQVTEMRNSHHMLTDVGTKAKTSSVSFSETEAANRSTLDAVSDA
ncbi:hypothetical protein CQY20_01655 [Mycolicibacterium agri]|uniref:ESX-1 secretion-associated protein n=1 Tax=Mycolicibacterium agri TaxID=36811 RepID=A0A2A7NG31_MYCAG|nr:DUF2563 family protein [Mycolicibacterium agri]PEG42723.1 hypothetical protein CQY20_01655 [Mycolicibacterium agri]GFG52710.1 hypothetical protein MAGR_41510 [Mycolicibacterium agri]